MKVLRDYQTDAVKASIVALREGEIPYLSMSTGSGKSLVLADLTNRALKQGGRVLQLVPSKELVEQNYKEAFDYVETPGALGICCAKLGKFQTNKQAVIATNTSFLRRRATSGAFNLCLIDEAHLCTPDPETSYRKIVTSLLRQNPRMKIVGVTATPYRMDQGMLHEKCFKGEPLFTKMAYETNMAELIENDYLSHVESISSDIEIDLTGIALSGKDYNTEQMGVKFDAIVEDAVADMRAKFEVYNIQTALIFASTVANAQRILEEWNDDRTMRIVYGDMSNHDRIHAINWIKNGAGKRYIVNVGVLTTGFDHTALDCVVLMRATKSLGLYVQMCGRVIRAHDDKERGYIIDYGTNIERHGPIDNTIPPRKKVKPGDASKKTCLLCGYKNLLSTKYCKECGAEFVNDSEEGCYSMRSKAQILAAKIEEQTIRYEIVGVIYERSYSRAAGLPMIKALFYDQDSELIHTHYICLDHSGYAGTKAQNFMMSLFKNISDYAELGIAGVNVDNCLELLNNNPEYFKSPVAITLAPGSNPKFKELKSVEYEHT